MGNIDWNEKVLCESKRHTTRRVASAHYAMLPYPVLDGGYPTNQIGVPPVQTWDGVPPPPSHADLALSPLLIWDGVASRKCWQTENITFPHPSDANGNKITNLGK